MLRYIITLLLSILLSLPVTNAYGQKTHLEVISSDNTVFDPYLINLQYYPEDADIIGSQMSFEKGLRQVSLDSLYQFLSGLSTTKKKVITKKTILTCELDSNVVATLEAYLSMIAETQLATSRYLCGEMEVVELYLKGYENRLERRNIREATAYLYWSIISLILLIIIVIAKITDKSYLQLASIILFSLSLMATLYFLQVKFLGWV